MLLLLSFDAEMAENELKQYPPAPEGTSLLQDPAGYYSTLGISSDADDATIRAAFVRLRAMYHPDRYGGEATATQRVMVQRFQQLNEAYDVLSDPRKRAAYSTHGRFGIDKLPLVSGSIHDKQSIGAVLDMLQREQDLKKLVQFNSSETQLEAAFDASNVNRAEDMPYLQSLSAVHTFLWPIHNIATLMLGFKATARHAKENIVSLLVDIETSLGRSMVGLTSAWHLSGPSLAVWWSRRVSAVSAMKTQFRFLNKGVFAPQMTIFFSRQLTRVWSLENELRLATRAASRGLRITLTRSSVEGGRPLELEAMLRTPGDTATSSLTATTTTSISAPSFGLGHGAASLVDVNHRAQITSSVSMEVSCDVMVNIGLQGVGVGLGTTVGPTPGFKISILGRRGSHTVNVPVAVPLPPGLIIWFLPISAFVPWLGARLAMIVCQPIVRVLRLRRAAILRRQDNTIGERFRGAMKDQAAMASIVQSRAEQERSIGGLVIKNAKFGIFKPSLKSTWYVSGSGQSLEDAPLVFDVTTVLQDAVHNSQIDIAESTTQFFSRIYNPHPYADESLEKRELRVTYWFNGRRHEACIVNDERLLLPQEVHLHRVSA